MAQIYADDTHIIDTEIFPFTLCVEWPDNRRTHPTVWTSSSLTNADCYERTFRMFADFHLEHKSRDFVDDAVETITNGVRSFRIQIWGP